MGELSSDFSNVDQSEFKAIIGPLVKAGSAALSVVNPWASVLYALLGGAVAEIFWESRSRMNQMNQALA